MPIASDATGSIFRRNSAVGQVFCAGLRVLQLTCRVYLKLTHLNRIQRKQQHRRSSIMRLGTIAATIAIIIAAHSEHVQAWQLNLTGQDLVWNPIEPSPAYLVGIENPASSSDPLIAWSLGLAITPDIGATGSLQFASATLPPNYLLEGRSEGLTPTFLGPATLIAPIGDSDSMFTGIVVPTTGMNLLATTFSASPDALGLFYISAVPDEFTGANWFSDDFQARAFQNVPFGGGPVVIGTITIVPEPSTIALGVIGILALFVFASPSVRSLTTRAHRPCACSLARRIHR